jgi:hypothetical protein
VRLRPSRLPGCPPAAVFSPRRDVGVVKAFRAGAEGSDRKAPVGDGSSSGTAGVGGARRTPVASLHFLSQCALRHSANPYFGGTLASDEKPLVEYSPLNNHGVSHFMRCIASPARGIPIKAGTYAPIVSVAGSVLNRNAIIVDCWGGSQRVCERADGRWQLATGDGFVAEFLPA